jgi:hypothetical protein
VRARPPIAGAVSAAGVSLVALVALVTLAAFARPAEAFVVSGRFLYEDRRFDGNGYTGAVQNLPIRHAKVEIVNAVTQQVLASGATGTDGRYALSVTGQIAPVTLFARCITDGRASGYELRVVDNFVRIPTVGLELTTSQLYAIATPTTALHNPTGDLDQGSTLIQDPDGTGVAQAFNIFDCGVDFFDWLALPGQLGRLPDAAEFLVYAWKATGTPGNPPPAFGSNYSQQGIFIGANPDPTAADTDGWSDTVILHETGHWFDDVYSRSDNPGGAHFIGDNDANVKLAYGEGAATYHCAKVREWRSSRLNLIGQAIDALVSLYADLTIPPPVGTPGGLSFSYDFETGNFADTGAPIGQRGSANETNVTSALWDMMDGPSTPDATPGADDETLEGTDHQAWQIEHDWLRSIASTNVLTVEDYYQGWFALFGAGAQAQGMREAFVVLAKMPFEADASEPDDALATAKPIVPVAYAISPAGKVVINEIELGAADAVELMNQGEASVDLTGWQIEVYANGTQQDPTRIYTFLPGTALAAGETIALHEDKDATSNGTYHVYGGDRTVFNASWNPGIDGAVVVRNATQQAVDFVRWRDANGVDNTTPAPAGTAWSGLLDTPQAPFTLARDVNGTDTDSATDWTGRPSSLGSVNPPSPLERTIYGKGDADVVSFATVAGKRYGVEARSSYSATDAKLEVLSPAGAVVATNEDSDVSVRDARVDFLAPTSGTYYARVTHTGGDTDWGEYTLFAFQRPGTVTCAQPGGLAADADHHTNTHDRVVLEWSNGVPYDSVRVYRDGTRIATLPGGASSYEDFADRGLYLYEVSGTAGGCGETGLARDYEFVGTIDCAAGDDFESGDAELWVTEGSSWGVTPLAASGTWAFTDSPAGTYSGCPLGESGCNHEAIAVLGQPADPQVPGYATLEFDQICITEHCAPEPCDRGIVEASDDGGATWTALASYDEASDPRWADRVAQPGDWRHESLDLSSYAGERIMVRFRLESDANLEFDGWYLDNVRIQGCTPVAVDPSAGPAVSSLRLAGANPMRRGAETALEYAVGRDAGGGPVEVSITLHDVTGRMVRALHHETEAPGLHRIAWNGTDGRGWPVASGIYYARLRIGSLLRTTKLVIAG